MQRVYFTIASNKVEQDLADKLSKNFPYHLNIIDEESIKNTNDPLFKEHMMAATSVALLKKNEEVVGISPYLMIGGTFEKDFEGDFSGVFFRNEKVPPPKAVWDVAPHMYVSRDFFCIKNEDFAKMWLEMCFKPFVKNYANREEDVLNMLVYYGDYKCKVMNIG